MRYPASSFSMVKPAIGESFSSATHYGGSGRAAHPGCRRGIGGTLFLVDEENDFYMIYMEQERGGPRAPFSNNVAQRMVYEAMRD